MQLVIRALLLILRNLREIRIEMGHNMDQLDTDLAELQSASDANTAATQANTAATAANTQKIAQLVNDFLASVPTLNPDQQAKAQAVIDAVNAAVSATTANTAAVTSADASIDAADPSTSGAPVSGAPVDAPPADGSGDTSAPVDQTPAV